MEIVCGWKLTAGSNPVLCAKRKRDMLVISLFRLVVFLKIEQDLRVGAVLREQNALPRRAGGEKNSTAKSTIDNR